MDKYIYEIRLIGCDDETNIYMALSEDDVILLDRISRASKEESKYNCMPRLKIEKYDTKILSEDNIIY